MGVEAPQPELNCRFPWRGLTTEDSDERLFKSCYQSLGLLDIEKSLVTVPGAGGGRVLCHCDLEQELLACPHTRREILSAKRAERQAQSWEGKSQARENLQCEIRT